MQWTELTADFILMKVTVPLFLPSSLKTSQTSRLGNPWLQQPLCIKPYMTSVTYCELVKEDILSCDMKPEGTTVTGNPCLSHTCSNHWAMTGTSPHNPLYVLHRWASVPHLAASLCTGIESLLHEKSFFISLNWAHVPIQHMPQLSCAQNLLHLEHGVEANAMLVFTSCYFPLNLHFTW